MAERASESEMQVLSALWDKSPQTAADLTSRIGKINGWTQATVKTLLARLVQKGAVTAEADGRRYLYSPAIERADAVGEESQRFVDRRSEEHTSELQSLMRISYAVFCLKKKNRQIEQTPLT